MQIVSSESLAVLSQTGVAIVLEALPFLLLGSLLSGLFEAFASTRWTLRIVPKGRLAGVAFGLLLGTLLPTCECGVVPIVRRLLKKGVPTHAAMSYMLAAPVMNPVVLAATWIAFRGDVRMVLLRAGVVCLAAGAVGLAMAGRPPGDLLRDGDADAPCGCGHDHGGEACPGEPAARAAGPLLPDMAAVAQAALPPAPSRRSVGSRVHGALGHATDDFLFAGQYLILGAFAAAAFKTFLPYSLLARLESNLFLAVGVMIGLAVVLSVCSEADAFVAASFATFPPAAKLAFVTLGPLFDLKLLFMYAGTFRRPVVLALAVVPALLVYVACVNLGLWLSW